MQKDSDVVIVHPEFIDLCGDSDSEQPTSHTAPEVRDVEEKKKVCDVTTTAKKRLPKPSSASAHVQKKDVQRQHVAQEKKHRTVEQLIREHDNCPNCSGVPQCSFCMEPNRLLAWLMFYGDQGAEK